MVQSDLEQDQMGPLIEVGQSVALGLVGHRWVCLVQHPLAPVLWNVWTVPDLALMCLLCWLNERS